ncbi:MAG: type II toxin-antitoxin system RelE/ParE family toxin [Janthinobacterium lividum]
MHSVLTTPTFERQATAAKLEEDEIEDIIAYLAANPRSGALMRETGGARKVRFEGNEGGKSGGYRRIHYFGGNDVPVFLLGLIDKSGKQANLTAAQERLLAHAAEDRRFPPR